MLYSGTFGVPYYPSNQKLFREALQEFNIDYKNKKFIDLGSGDGRMVIAAEKLGMKAKGVEINPFLTLSSKLLLFLFRTKNAQIVNKSYYNVNLKNVDIVYVYLLREHMEKLRKKLLTELKDGSVIISNTFTFDHIEPDAVYKKFKLYRVSKK